PRRSGPRQRRARIAAARPVRPADAFPGGRNPARPRPRCDEPARGAGPALSNEEDGLTISRYAFQPVSQPADTGPPGHRATRPVLADTNWTKPRRRRTSAP